MMTRPQQTARTLLAVGGLLACVQPADAWPGHKYEDWKKTTTWTKPDTATDQAGRSALAPLLRDEKDAPIDEIRAWEAKRAQYADCIQAILGKPTDLTVPLVEVQVLGEETLDDHVRRHIRIRSEADDWIPAYLLLPRSMPADRRLPTMICVHQTVAQGKEETCGISGDASLAFALQLVRRGYVCIAPDMIGFGERILAGTQPYHDSAAFYKRHAGWSFMGKMVWDMSRVVDYLRTLPFVDPLQIGGIGHSHGAYTVLFAAAFDPRISLTVASCGFTTFRSDPQPERWSHLTALIPQIGTYLPDVKSIPFDWQHVCAMIAPRSLYVWYATQDSIFPNTNNLDALLKDVRGVYGLYGAADDLSWRAFDGPHKFPDEGREIAYRWIDKRFFPTDEMHAKPAGLTEWTARRELIRRVVRRDLGRPPTSQPALDVKIIESEPQGGYERRLIEYSVDRGDRVRAYLCVGDKITARQPAVLVLHQTVPEGKRESVGLAGNPSLAFASELANRGYVTLAPDSITAGERVDAGGAFDTRGFYAGHPSLSAMGKMLYDAQRAVDLLASMDEVDAKRIGVIGHSLGAEEALMLAAFDERVAATVASCGYSTFAAGKNRLVWARDRWFSYMPKLRPVFLRDDLPAWDWPDVVRLIAPRSLYQHTTTEDQIFPESRSAFAAGESARPVWTLYGREEHLTNVLKPGKHAIAHDTKLEMYEWLDRQLSR
jgi:dienelactone hydrolase